MIGATVRPSAQASRGDLGLRLVSAAILGPAVIAAIALGSPLVELLVLLAAGLLAWEWAALCGADRRPAASAALLPAVLAVVLAAVFGRYELGLWLIPAGAAVGGLALAAFGARHPAWLALGVPYLALPCLTLLWLRLQHEAGGALVVWLLLVIWATDSGAYLAGRTIGGPKLAPSVSPKKTWAGLAGGALAAALVGAAGSLLEPGYRLLPLALLGILLALLSQLGDLFESHVKRRFGVKDAGRLIPGHGGLLDRVDGLIVGTLVMGALVLWRGSAP